MIEEIQRIFRDAWAAFRAEAARREPEDEVATLLAAMRREMVAARANLPLYEAACQRAEAELERERAQLADCLRRRAMAEKVGDAETVRVADDFAARHRAAVGVLEAKLAAARAERELRVREAEEMMRRYKEADANRFALLAEIRTRRANATLHTLLGDDAHSPTGANTTDAEFLRHADRLRAQATYGDVLADLDRDLGHTAPPPSALPDATELDRRLAELKRRMGR